MPTGLGRLTADRKAREGIHEGEAGKQKTQRKVARLQPPGREVLFHIKDGLQGQPYAPEHGDVGYLTGTTSGQS